MRLLLHRFNAVGGLSLFVLSLLAAASSALAQCPPFYAQNFDYVRAPLLPTGWAASQDVNVTGAPLWVTSSVSPFTAPNDAFSTAPDNILDNRLDSSVLVGECCLLGLNVTFDSYYDLQSGRDGAVLEVSAPNINGGAFTDITDPAVGGFVTPGYNSIISTAFQSPIAGRAAWSGNSGGYVNTFVRLVNAVGNCRLRFRLVSDNSGASAGWRIDNFIHLGTECSSPTPSPTPSVTPTATATATAIATPCGSPNLIADSTFEAGPPWPGWTVQTSTNFGTPLCDLATCGTAGGQAPPYAGNNWAWFGGASAPETATAGQSVVIPAGSQATLSFVMAVRSTSVPLTDVLRVTVDGIVVQSYPETQGNFNYTPYTIDLSAFADGSSHLILFEYVGPSNSPCNYVVDNVTLTAGGACPSPAAQALNLSTRLLVQTGDNVGIGGFIITGNSPKQILLRALGTSLLIEPVPLADPILELHGPPGFVTIIVDNCEPTADGSAGPLPTPCPCSLILPPHNPLEPCILATLDPGAYTAIVKGNNNGVGVSVLEIYDLDSPGGPSKLANISTRAFDGTGGEIMIAGFILGGNNGQDTIVMRGIGPSLSAFGIPNVLANPQLELRNNSGAIVRSNNDWMDDPTQAMLIQQAGLAPINNLESAIYETLEPGQYTALLSGVNNGTGVGLVEVYDLFANEPVPTPTPTPSGSPSPSPTPSPSASPSPSPGACVENWDSVTAPALPAGWVASNPKPGDGTMWVTSTISSDTPPNNAFVPDQDGISGKVLDRTGVQVKSTSATFSFRNNFDTEFSDGIYWDGYVLEISAPNISNGDFLDITDPRVGGSFVSGGYTGEITPDGGNPLSGRMAWSGDSGGYIDTIINLGPNLTGQTVTFRFRMGTDEAVAAPGVRIDNLVSTDATCP